MHYDDSTAFVEYSNHMQDFYNNIEEYNLVLIFFDDMIADMINNKKLNPVVTELYIRGIKLNISIVFITESYFKVLKAVRQNSTQFFIMKIPKKKRIPRNCNKSFIRY